MQSIQESMVKMNVESSSLDTQSIFSSTATSMPIDDGQSASSEYDDSRSLSPALTEVRSDLGIRGGVHAGSDITMLPTH